MFEGEALCIDCKYIKEEKEFYEFSSNLIKIVKRKEKWMVKKGICKECWNKHLKNVDWERLHAEAHDWRMKKIEELQIGKKIPTDLDINIVKEWRKAYG